MKAWAMERHGSLEQLAWREVETPAVRGDGDVLVRVLAAALNPSEWKVMTGRDGGRFLHATRFPLAVGYDYSGIVEDVGAGVMDVKKGDEVFGFLPYSRSNRQGSCAELVVAPETELAHKPAAVSHLAAASVATAGCTALQAMRHARAPSEGQRLLIHGASGGVGSCAVPIAKHAGAEVWGTASKKNLDYIEGLGADYAVDYRETAPSALEEPFDAVIDCAAASSYGECVRIMKPGATYVTLLPQGSTLTGWMRSLFSSRRVRFVIVKALPNDLTQLGDWLREGVIAENFVGVTYPMGEVPAALERLKKGDVTGKIAIDAS